MKRILVVIGNYENRMKLSNLLIERGYRVVQKADAASALTILAGAFPFDLIIADYVLPDTDAAGFMGCIRKTRSVFAKVIFLSDRVRVMDYLAALSLGAFEFFFRPVHSSELLRVVNAAVRRNVDIEGDPGSPGARSADDGAGIPDEAAQTPAVYPL